MTASKGIHPQFPLEAVRTRLCLLAVLAIGVFTAKVSALPPRYEVPTSAAARLLAGPQCVAVLGTGSMRPFIPANPDPRLIVAYVATEKTPYADLQKGELVVYRLNNEWVIHQIVARQGDNWIASGLANRRYDAVPVTRETYERRVVRVYVITP